MFQLLSGIFSGVSAISFKPYLYAAGALAILTGVWWYGDNRYDAGFDKARADAVDEQLERERQIIARFNVMVTQTQKAEKEAWKQYEEAINRPMPEQPVRVRVVYRTRDTVCPTEATGVGNGTVEVVGELPRENQERLERIGREADQCEAKLKALQGYINALTISARTQSSTGQWNHPRGAKD